MHCFDAQRELEACADGEQSPERAALLERHLAGCGACQAELARLQAVVEAIETWPLVIEPARLTNRIMAHVRPRPARPRFRLRWSDLALSLAGGGLAFAAVLIWRRLISTDLAHLRYTQIALQLELLRLEAMLMIQRWARAGGVTLGLALVVAALVAALAVAAWGQVTLYAVNGRPRTSAR